MEVEQAIDITAEERETLLSLLEQHLPGAAVWVYGSRTKWTARPQSDLDLVVFPTSEQRKRVGDLREALEESNLPFRVDLFVWDDVPESFRGQIRADHVVIADAKARGRGDGWRKITLGDAITLKRGYDLPQHQRTEGRFPVVSSSGTIDHHSKSKVSGPGVVTGRYGTLGKVFFIPNDFWPLNTALYVRDFKGNDPRFISYFLKHLDFSSYSDKAAVPGLNRNHLHETSVRIPANVSEQRAIAHVLGTLDDKIELNQRMNATLEAMAQALFKSWFVDFDPVRAKMEGRDTGLTKDIADMFPDRLVNSDSGEVPEGWEVSTIGQEVDVVGGSTPSTKVASFWNGSINWATPKDLSALASPVLIGTARQISQQGLERISSGLLPRGTVLLSSRAPIGYLAITDVPVAINQGFIAMKCGRRLSAVYAWLWAASHMDKILENANGSTFLEISKRSFRPLPVVVPSDGVRSIHARITQSLYNRIVKNERASGVLASARDELLPKLVSGELRVRDAEEFAATIA